MGGTVDEACKYLPLGVQFTAHVDGEVYVLALRLNEEFLLPDEHPFGNFDSGDDAL